jgi:hypothetical protein
MFGLLEAEIQDQELVGTERSRVGILISEPSVGAVDRRDDLAPALFGDHSAPHFQLGLGNQVEKIALTQRGPIQAVARVKDDLVRHRFPRRLLTRAHEDIEIRFVRNPVRR